MRVLLIHQAFVSPRDAGGTRHFEFAQFCQRAGHQLMIVASNLSYLTGRRAAAPGEGPESPAGVKVIRAYTFPSLHRSFAWRIVSFLSFMCSSVWAGLRAGRIDLVMGTSPPIFQALSAWLVAFLRRRPFLLEIRDLWPAFAIDMGVLRNRFLIGAARALERFLYRRATHLLVNSPAYREYLLGQGIPSNKITLIPNGVDVSAFDAPDQGQRIRKEFGLDGHFVVTYAGALGLANDIPTILRAAHRLRDHPEIRFLLLGDGKERPSLEAQSRQMNLPNVTFAGARPKAEMPEFLAASDACVATLQDIPMFRTTYPNKVFDYMAAARPTVLAIDGVIRQVLETAAGGVFVPPGNDQAMAESILKLQANPSAARRMGLAAREYVLSHFNRADQATAFISLIERWRSN